MYKAEARQAAIVSFKDWSNYMLVTTVAALGWISSGDVGLPAWSLVPTIVLLAASVILGIFTLAMIPLIAEKLGEDGGSFYDETASFKLLWFVWKVNAFRIKYVCWPQHVTFVVGIALYGAGAVCSFAPME